MAKNIELVRQEVAAMSNEVEDFANSAERVGGVVSDVLEYSHAESERAKAAEERLTQQVDGNFDAFSELGMSESAKGDGYEIALMKKTNTAEKTKVKVPVYDMQNPSATPVGLVDEIFVEDMKAEAKKMVDAEAERAEAKEQKIEGDLATEAERAKSAEGTIMAKALDNAGKIKILEDVSATKAELSAEAERASNAEKNIATLVQQNEGKIKILEDVSATKAELSAEAERAQSAEKANADAIAAEVERAGAKEQEIEGKVTELESRTIEIDNKFLVNNIHSEHNTDIEDLIEIVDNENNTIVKIEEKGVQISDIKRTNGNTIVSKEVKLDDIGDVSHIIMSKSSERAIKHIREVTREPSNDTTESIEILDKNNKSILVIDDDGVNIKKLNCSIGAKSNIDAYNIDYATMTHILVKKDGTGDYMNIQDAINSVADASINSQYCIDVYDDFIVDDIAELNYCHTPDLKADIEEVNGYLKIIPKPATDWAEGNHSFLALVSTKDWVHIRGVGKQKALIINCYQNIEPSDHQYIQTLWVSGNSIVENFRVEITGGRYAVHQDQSWHSEDANNPEVNATSVYKNCLFIHNGKNNTTSNWTALCAQANGIADGQKMVFINTTWIGYLTPFYTHTNSRYGDAYINSPSMFFDNCQVMSYTGMTAKPYLQDLGCGQKTLVKIINSNIAAFMSYNEVPVNYATTKMGTLLDNYWNGGAYFSGGGNGRMMAYSIRPDVLTFKVAKSSSIDIVGGNAVPFIFGDVHKKVSGSSAIKGFIQGSVRIAESSKTKIWLLAWRLGNCATENKGIVFNIDGNTYTMVFNQDYMGGSSYDYSTAPIDAYNTNAKFLAYMLSLRPTENQSVTFGDLMEITIENETDGYYLDCVADSKKVIPTGKLNKSLPVGYPVRCNTGGNTNVWQELAAGERLTGLIATPYDKNEVLAEVIVAEKTIFHKDDIKLNISLSSGQLVKWDGTEYVLTSNDNEACLIAIDTEYVKLYK